MSDNQDEVMETLAAHLSRAYSALATICLNLPIPVTLPATGAVSNLEAVPAVRRVMDIAEDQPMPEQQQATLFAICAFWLAGLDLYGLLAINEFHIARANSAAANLLMADDHMLDLGVWLFEQQEGERD
ncbi:hypothetical protein [Streptomyces sp. NPDC059928]|uniref:hypothetical protein n=1 Tax=unclassified Streptomyces TaxID=2593676 RepID=UPI003653CD3E